MSAPLLGVIYLLLLQRSPVLPHRGKGHADECEIHTQTGLSLARSLSPPLPAIPLVYDESRLILSRNGDCNSPVLRGEKTHSLLPSLILEKAKEV